VVQAVTVIMGVVVGLTFLFGFGNVLNLALQLGVPVWVAPLVAPAVDLSILGLLLGTRHLALTGASPEVLRPARRLLIFASVVTLALNVAEPLVAGEFGKAAFDAVGPLLLIGWSESAPASCKRLAPRVVRQAHPKPSGLSRLSMRTRMNVCRNRGPNSTRTSCSKVASEQSLGERRRLSWRRPGEKTRLTVRLTRSRYPLTRCAFGSG